MRDVLTAVLWWQVLLLVGWMVSRRLGRVERSLQPGWYAQLGALREQVIGLRREHAAGTGDLIRRARDVEEAVAELEDEVREFARLLERTSRLLLERIHRLEQRLHAHEQGKSKDGEP